MFYYRSDTYFRLCSLWRAQYISDNISSRREKQTLCYRRGTVRITNCVAQQVHSALQTVLHDRYSLHYKLCYRTGTVRITNCATEQVQSALQTVLQDRYSLHYQLCYITGSACITNCSTEQVSSHYLKFSILATCWART